MQCQKSLWFSETQEDTAPEFDMQRSMLEVRKELNLEAGTLNFEFE
jgi:hypothetical protein